MGKSRTRWGRPTEFATFALVVAVIGAAAALRWQWLDLAFAVSALAFVIAGSIILLARSSMRRNGDPSARLGQLAIFPRRLRRWMLGESDQRRND